MITYSTEFPLDPTNEVSDVVHLALEWLAGSPHTALVEADAAELPTNDAVTLNGGSEQATIACATGDGYQIGGLQYRRTEDSLEWCTSIVARKDESELLLSLQVSCESVGTATRLPVARKPYFIKQALAVLGGGMDGAIPVGDKPFVLDEKDVAIAGALVNGVAKNRLPIIYLSADHRKQTAVPAADLSVLVSGIAHVVVEPSRAFSLGLRDLTEGRNAYGGAVGVYWPQSKARRLYALDRSSGDPRALQRQLAQDIRSALANRRLRTQCTWLHLQEVLSSARVERLKQAGSTSVEDYVKAFDAELKNKNDLLAEANAEVARLTQEVNRLSAVAEKQEAGILQPGTEQDLYEYEIHDILVCALKDAARNSKEGSRRLHILNDLIVANELKGKSQDLDAEVKAALKTYKTLDAKTRAVLIDIGFKITEDGKHYKLVFRGDPRYTFALSKTSSDHRAGKNMASEISSTLF